MPFDYTLDFKLSIFPLSSYRVGRAGSALVEPYKLKSCPYWRFKLHIAKSSKRKNTIFLDYLQQDDFVGADMAESFTMGYTRSEIR